MRSLSESSTEEKKVQLYSCTQFQCFIVVDVFDDNVKHSTVVFVVLLSVVLYVVVSGVLLLIIVLDVVQFITVLLKCSFWFCFLSLGCG